MIGEDYLPGHYVESHICAQDKWEPDELSEKCTSCTRPFSFFCRRHHCRICGKIFCGTCSDNVVASFRMCDKCNRKLKDKYSKFKAKTETTTVVTTTSGATATTITTRTTTTITTTNITIATTTATTTTTATATKTYKMNTPSKLMDWENSACPTKIMLQGHCRSAVKTDPRKPPVQKSRVKKSGYDNRDDCDSIMVVMGDVCSTGPISSFWVVN